MIRIIQTRTGERNHIYPGLENMGTEHSLVWNGHIEPNLLHIWTGFITPGKMTDVPQSPHAKVRHAIINLINVWSLFSNEFNCKSAINIKNAWLPDVQVKMKKQTPIYQAFSH